jgi:hypothetical protein
MVDLRISQYTEPKGPHDVWKGLKAVVRIVDDEVFLILSSAVPFRRGAFDDYLGYGDVPRIVTRSRASHYKLPK